ncbi:hypothetical protein MPDQ_002892 [Monascus purpureus]|uniref:FAD/NAD(P)-binding domain-containing protein n=1 Tax=Monascus purpureus TaxID=5098 RepID=A0A507QNQ3_MONPU|nr:hypothetical protein MPDQ_002892 [Monascus purpureus]
MPSEIVPERAPFRVLVIGGSYAGFATIVNLLDLCHGKPCRFAASKTDDASRNEPEQRRVPIQVTFVDERDGYYHLIGSPLAFASSSYAAKAWVPYEEIPALKTPEVQFVHGTVVEVNCQAKEATIKENNTQTHRRISYDYLIAASGLRRNWPTVPQALRRKEYLLEMAKHIDGTVRATDGVAVIGGGAVGIEMAAELKAVRPECKVTLVHSRARLLSSEPLPDEVGNRALDLLHETGVETIMSTRVTNIEKKDEKTSVLSLSDGRQITCSLVINAISKFTPTSSYLPASILDDNGYVKIKANLEFPDNAPNAYYHHAAGDIAAWPGIKRCGAAMHHGHYTAINLHQKMLAELDRSSALTMKLVELARDVPGVIGLAIGKKAVSYNPLAGVQSGEDVMKVYFENDLGYRICWDYMRLGEAALV